MFNNLPLGHTARKWQSKIGSLVLLAQKALCIPL